MNWRIPRVRIAGIGRLLSALAMASSMMIAANLDQAAAAFQSAKYREVVVLLRPAAKVDGDAAFLLGKAEYQLGNFSAAADALELAVKAHPGDALRYLWLGRAYGMKADNANPFSAMGLARKARDAFERAVQLDPRNLEAVSDLFAYYLAAPSFLGGGVAKARALSETIRELDPAEYASLQAQLAEKNKEYAAAERNYQEAIRHQPESVGRRIDLAKFYIRREVYARADEQLAKAKRLNPGAARLLFDEANLLVRSARNPARARQLLAAYEKAQKTSDDAPPFEVQQLLSKAEKLEK